MAGQLVGVDVGGTFTDLIWFDQGTGQVKLAKVPTTLSNQAFGVIDAIKQASISLPELDLIVHGTTTTTNAVLERKLNRTGLITTQGFRDILELGRRTRPQAYGMTGQFTPVIPRDLRLEVPERMDAAGRVVTPLDDEAVRQAAQHLLSLGCESVVIHFLHAYANPVHEIQAANQVTALWPNDYVSMGHSLLSESREFERGVTAAINASVQPLLERYIRRLDEELVRGGYAGELLVVNGNGGMVTASLVAREAAKTVMSGPASGVMAAVFVGRRAGRANLITYDMGGTSTDVALIRDAEASVSNEIELEYGMPIHVPMVDVRTVGAGGGSIARINAGGLLEVGPDSAGASPGPVCYGRGGTLPTLSDANFLLGRLNPDRIAAADSTERYERVRRHFEQQLGAALSLDAISAAAAVLQVANARMAGAIRMVSVSLGADPRDYALFAFGGAGPLHATALARELSVPTVLIPARPGITNALGCLVAELRHDFVRTVNTALDVVNMDEVHAVFAAQQADGRAMIERQRVSLIGIRCQFSVDMQFVGQTHLLRVSLDTSEPTRDSLGARFEKAYRDRFDVELAEVRANLVNINTSVIGERTPLDLSTLIDPAGRAASAQDAQRGSRPVYFDGEWMETPVYWRDALPCSVQIEGPAIIEQMDTTTLLEPFDLLSGDADGNLLIELQS